jgi:hypothetical protein
VRFTRPGPIISVPQVGLDVVAPLKLGDRVLQKPVGRLGDLPQGQHGGQDPLPSRSAAKWSLPQGCFRNPHRVGGIMDDMLTTEYADSIRSGPAKLPGDQQNSEWANEYRQVLEKATGQADGHSASQPVRITAYT